ncbi:MAG TPA: hypothetical protein VFS33_10105 [Gemmatimonadales bacterium]|nr:hypothetical protein [Gemmatimonadales bacterium]
MITLTVRRLTVRRTLAALALAVAAGSTPAAAKRLAAQGAPSQPQQLVYAIYDGTSTASRVFTAVTAPGQPAADGAVAAVANEGKGTVTVQQQKATGLAQTALLRGIIGLLGPQGGAAPGSAPIGGTAVDSLRSSLVPGTSAIVAIVSAPAAPAVTATLRQNRPRQVMSTRVATP